MEGCAQARNPSHFPGSAFETVQASPNRKEPKMWVNRQLGIDSDMKGLDSDIEIHAEAASATSATEVCVQRTHRQ